MGPFQFRLVPDRGLATGRSREPVTVGVPFPRGWCADESQLALTDPGGRQVPLQARRLDSWSDGSVRWALLDFQTPGEGEADGAWSVEPGAGIKPLEHLVVEHNASGITIETWNGRFSVNARGELHAWPTRPVGRGFSPGATGTDVVRSALRINDHNGQPAVIAGGELQVEVEGPLRTVVLVTTQADVAGRPLHLFIRYEFFAGVPMVRVQVTLRNPSRAVHEGGFWELGDPGSLLLADVSFDTTLGEPVTLARGSMAPDEPWRELELPVTLSQESSGGEHWDSRVHLNRDGIVPHRRRGYTLAAGEQETTGLRATPVFEAHANRSVVAFAQRQFWERFPKSVSISDRTMRVGMLPIGPAVHELQGGEQITERFVVAFGTEAGVELPLEWVRSPVRVQVEPGWYCGAEALSHLVAEATDVNKDYLTLVNEAIEGDDSFAAKRERVDEYGWRHFGDLYGDHETVHHQGPDLFVSHYNNQYDAIAGFLAHHFRTGDWRWRALADDLARHVVDVDIYHTDEDKAAYNHGLFWHTNHHVDAGLSTHRTYPRAGQASGGPSAEHNYTTGLMLYHFLTGDPSAREAVLELADWVLEMDDGRRTPLWWLSSAPTGFASHTGSVDYHGPGRGPGNGIVTLLNAFRLTSERRYLEKAEQLIRRCVHPQQDLDALNLLDAERRWYYTVFLQSLGRYLDLKSERAEIDDGYAYAQATLLHYARWMAQHEYPYLEKPDILQFPTETWAAQDMRKSEVFRYAMKHAVGEERHRFWERAEFFFNYSVRTLAALPTHRFTRPMVLLLTLGVSHAYFQQYPDVTAPQASGVRFGKHARFVPQKQLALRRLAMIGIAALAGAIALALHFLA